MNNTAALSAAEIRRIIEDTVGSLAGLARAYDVPGQVGITIDGRLYQLPDPAEPGCLLIDGQLHYSAEWL